MNSNFQNSSSTPNFQKEDSMNTNLMTEEAIKLSANDERLLALGEGFEGLNARVIKTPELLDTAAEYTRIATLGNKSALAYDTVILVCNPVRKRGVRPGQTDEKGKAIQVFNRTQYVKLDAGARWKLNCHYQIESASSFAPEDFHNLDVAAAGYRWDLDLDFLPGIEPAWKAFNEMVPDGSPLVLVVAHVVSRTRFAPYQFSVPAAGGTTKLVKGHVQRVRVSYAELYLLPAVFQKEEKATRGKLGALKNGMANAVTRGAEELDKNKAGRAGKFLLD